MFDDQLEASRELWRRAANYYEARTVELEAEVEKLEDALQDERNRVGDLLTELGDTQVPQLTAAEAEAIVKSLGRGGQEPLDLIVARVKLAEIATAGER